MGSYARNAQQCEGERNKLAGACVFPNRLVFGMYNQGSAALNSYSVLGSDSVNLFPATLSASDYEKKIRFVVHEFGHMLGYLQDEYSFTATARPATLTESDRLVKNCVHGDVRACLDPSSNYWQNMVGQGCGNPQTVDCIPGVAEYNLEVQGCVLAECHYTTSLRPNNNTIMRDQNTDPYRFGPVNERLLCEKMVEKTSTVLGGMC